nr:reverse transcriptase domain-containing protein [Tanacetum cinerariifolium]
HVNFDLKTTGDHRKLQLNKLSELHDQAYENSVIYKERIKKLHDSKIKNRIFNVNGHRVKDYFGGDIPSIITPDLHTFPKDNKIRGSSRAHDSDYPQRLKFSCIGIFEEIDIVSITNNVLPPSDDDSDEEVDDVRVDNFIQNFEHEYSESEDSDFDNPLLPLPPPKPPDKEFDFKIDFQNEISVVRNAIVKFDARVKFDVFNDKNDVLSYFMFAKEFSLLSAESEDTIFDP